MRFEAANTTVQFPALCQRNECGTGSYKLVAGFERPRHPAETLFDGVSGFVVGADDTLLNMRWRLDKLCAGHPLGAMVIEIFERVQREGNVYARFRELYMQEKKAKRSWWQD